MIEISKRVIKNFEDKIFKHESGCWIWTAAKCGSEGYGAFGFRGRGGFRAHRVSWIVYRGEIPDGMNVCHKCDNPPCVNPDHLFLGSKHTNMQDAGKKGRLQSGLNESQVLGIVDMVNGGKSKKETAAVFGIKLHLVQKIMSGRRMSYITGIVHSPKRRIQGVPSGEQNGNSKLKEFDIPKIHEMYADGESQISIGKCFGVSNDAIHLVLNGKAWRRFHPILGKSQ